MKYRPARRRPLRKYKTVTLRSKLKVERRKTAGKFLLYSSMAAAIFLGGCWAWKTASGFLFGSDNFRIASIDIRGIKNVTRSEIIALLPFREGDNIFSFRLMNTEKNLRQCKPELKSITLSRRWKKVVINIEERTPVAYTLFEGQRMGLDNDNKPFPLRGKWVKEFLPQISNSDESERKAVLEFIKQFSPVAKELFPRVRSVALASVNDMVMELKDGPEIFWGACEKNKFEPKLKKLAQVFEDARARFSRIDYVNLCYFDDGRILVKPAAQ